MKALLFESHGGPGNLRFREDLPDPTPTQDEVIVEVQATSVNRVDQVILAGYPGLNARFPHILGGDVAGTIAGTHKRVVSLPMVPCRSCGLCKIQKPHLCERYQYLGMHRPGGYASRVALPSSGLLELPATLSFEQGAALGVAGLTALHALEEARRHHSPGGWLMIWGATGGLGAFAIQLARSYGLRVIATTRDPERMQSLKDLGAEITLSSDAPDLVEQVKRITGSGCDQVIDYVGPATFPRSFEMVRKGGVITLCGILTGREAPLSLHQTYFRHLTIQGVYLGSQEEFARLIDLAGKGEIRVPIAGTFAIHEGVRAHEYFLGARPTGKVVLTHALN